MLAHLPFYFCLLPMYLDLVTHTASVAAQQAAKHLRRVGRVRPPATPPLPVLLLPAYTARGGVHGTWGTVIPESAPAGFEGARRVHAPDGCLSGD